jgi:LPXTG-motif cell wall-anchored protein
MEEEDVMRKLIGVLMLAASTAAVLAPSAVSAQGTPEDKRVFFSFSGPVAVPGVTLPAGKYLFRLPTTIASGERHVMQVLSADGRNSYAMFYGISANRADYPSKPEVRFMETAAGVPPAVKTWWYPGDKAGYEFIYPKEQARLLAEGTGQPVLVTETEAITPAGTEEAYVPEPPAVPRQPVLVGELAPAAIPVIEPPLEARQELPKTASNTVAVALAGAVLFLGAVLLKVRRATLM